MLNFVQIILSKLNFSIMTKTINIFLIILLAATTSCSQQANKKAAEMTFKDELVFDFGKILEKSDGTTEFVFKNTGKKALIITNVKSSCGCTIPTYPIEPIAKNKTGVIAVKYDTKRIGVFTKTITVYSNSKNSPIKLIIKGEVIKNK